MHADGNISESLGYSLTDENDKTNKTLRLNAVYEETADRQTDTETDTERQTQRQTQRQTETETETETDRETETETERQTDRQTDPAVLTPAPTDVAPP